MQNNRRETLTQTWRALVAQNRNAVALIDGASGKTWTREALENAATQWVETLTPKTRAQLVRRRVVMAEHNGQVWFQVFLGLLSIGAIPAPADSKEADARLDAIAQQCGAAAIWREGRLDLLAPRPAQRRRDVCLIKLTSGSTGLPKALTFSHAQMLADGRHIASSMGIRADDVNLGVIPFGHSYGLGNLVVPLLVQGTAIVCAASPFPQVLAADCARWRATIFPAVPTLVRALVRSEIAREAFASVRFLISAGAPLTPEEVTQFSEKFGQRIHNFYGTSETGGIAYDRLGEASATGRAIGKLMDGVQLHWWRGQRFAVESAAVRGRGKYSPPDRGELNTLGELVLLGRAGRTLKIAGRRLDPAEVETALRALPGVREAFVTAHPGRADALAAAVCVGTKAAKTAFVVADCRAQLARRLAMWKIPDRIVVLAAFPVTLRGKTDRVALLELLK